MAKLRPPAVKIKHEPLELPDEVESQADPTQASVAGADRRNRTLKIRRLSKSKAGDKSKEGIYGPSPK
eukprot:4038124-Amphidinium_carterae.1